MEKAKAAIKRNEAIQVKLENLILEVSQALEKTRQANKHVYNSDSEENRKQTTAYAPTNKQEF